MTNEEKDEQFYRDTVTLPSQNSTTANSRYSSHPANDARCGVVTSSSLRKINFRA